MKGSTAIILILVSIGLFYTLINPEYAKVKVLRSQAAEYQGVLDNVSKLIATRDDLLDKYKAIPQAEIDRLGKVLPDNLDTVKLALDLDTLGSKYGVTVKSVQTLKNDTSTGAISLPDGKAYQNAQVSFDFVATYDNFQKFLRDVETSQRISNVKEITFQTTDNGLYEYRMILETYWLK